MPLSDSFHKRPDQSFSQSPYILFFELFPFSFVQTMDHSSCNSTLLAILHVVMGILNFTLITLCYVLILHCSTTSNHVHYYHLVSRSLHLFLVFHHDKSCAMSDPELSEQDALDLDFTEDFGLRENILNFEIEVELEDDFILILRNSDKINFKLILKLLKPLQLARRFTGKLNQCQEHFFKMHLSNGPSLMTH